MPYRLSVAGSLVSIGAIELSSIAVGYRVADAMMKQAESTLLDARAYCPGKFLIVVGGELAAVEESMAAGLAQSGTALFGSMLVPSLHPGVIPAINRQVRSGPIDTLGVLEAFSAVAVVDAADAAAKAAEVTLESVNLLEGLGGKAYLVLTGELTDVEAAIAAARMRVPADMFVASEVIPRLAGELGAFLPGAG